MLEASVAELPVVAIKLEGTADAIKEVFSNNEFDELVNELIPNIRNILIDHKRNISNRSVNTLLKRSRRRPYRRRF